jgi:acrylyl-CoA reductase (NADPH)
MPLSLRGVALIGITSIEMPTEMRNRAWERLGDDLRPKHLADIITREISLEELPGAFDGYLSGSVLGRTVVKIV